MTDRATPMTDSVIETIAEFAEGHGLPPSGGALYAGFSGGADSTALVVALHRLGIPFTAVHFQHGLRGDAEGDQVWCLQFCHQRGIPFVQRRLDVPVHQSTGEGIEAAARRCRLLAWRDLCQPDDAVALGHHGDDALETLLLRMMRGSGTTGLVGLRPDRVVEGVRLVRPLLTLRRAQLTAFLREADVSSWREDATNEDTAIRRNAVRHQLLPLLRDVAGTDAGLLRSLHALGDDADFLERTVAQADARTGDSTAALATLHPALRGRLLRRRIQQEFDVDHPLAAETQKRVLSELGTPSSEQRRIPLGQGLSLRLNGDGTFAVVPDEAGGGGSQPAREWAWRETPELHLPDMKATLRAVELAVASEDALDGAYATDAVTELFDADALPDVLVVRAWRHGDRMVPFGFGQPVKVQDLLTNDGVPRHSRLQVPLVCAGDRIIWLAGVRRAEFARTAPGRPAVCLQLDRHRMRC